MGKVGLQYGYTEHGVYSYIIYLLIIVLLIIIIFNHLLLPTPVFLLDSTALESEKMRENEWTGIHTKKVF